MISNLQAVRSGCSQRERAVEIQPRAIGLILPLMHKHLRRFAPPFSTVEFANRDAQALAEEETGKPKVAQVSEAIASTCAPRVFSSAHAPRFESRAGQPFSAGGCQRDLAADFRGSLSARTPRSASARWLVMDSHFQQMREPSRSALLILRADSIAPLVGSVMTSERTPASRGARTSVRRRVSASSGVPRSYSACRP